MFKNQLLGVPVVQRYRASRAAPYRPEKNSVDYIEGVFENSSRLIRSRHPISGTVMEIGPGGNLGGLLMYLAAGCERGVAFDLVELVTDQQDLYADLASDAGELLKRIEYRVGEPIEQTSIPSESFDIIFSAACLEHVGDPDAALRSIFRLLEPGGVTTHSIDLRDHRDFGAPLAFLRYSDRVWRAASSRRLVTNRWRASDWQRGFEAVGFTDIDVEVFEEVPATDRMRAQFHRRFRNNDLADLGALIINVTATKPA